MSNPSTPDAAEYSMEYAHIDAALKSRWQSFIELEKEINTFQPRQITDFFQEREALFAHLRSVNPKADDESLAVIADGQIISRADPNRQFYEQYDQRLMTEYVTVALLSHALCESAINAILAVCLAETDASALFNLIERADIKDKWQFAPKAVLPSYELPRSAALYESLNYLTKQRNALVHHKIQVHVAGKKIFEGSHFNREPYDESLRWIRRFFRLPYDLADHARNHLMPRFPVFVLIDRRPIA